MIINITNKKKVLFGFIITLFNSYSFAELILTPPINNYISHLEKKYNFNKKNLTATFKQATVKPEILKAIQAPSEKKPWYVYKKIFLTPKRITAGVQFMSHYKKTLNRAERTYGTPPEVITAILGVETFYGKIQGKYKVMDALVTLAFNFPKRSKFFKKELTEYLLFTKKNNIPPLSVKGSYAGAIGQPQFIPSSIRHYAVDFNNDNQINLNTNTDDAIGSIGNYLGKHGWKRNQTIISKASAYNSRYLTLYKKQKRKPKYKLIDWVKRGISIKNKPNNLNQKVFLIALNTGPQTKKKQLWIGYNNFYVITRYNHSKLYAMAVSELSKAIKTKHDALNNKNA